MGLLEGRASVAEPTKNVFFEGMKMRKVWPSLTMSKIFFPITGAWPITRMEEGRAARMKP